MFAGCLAARKILAGRIRQRPLQDAQVDYEAVQLLMGLLVTELQQGFESSRRGEECISKRFALSGNMMEHGSVGLNELHSMFGRSGMDAQGALRSAWLANVKVAN